MSGVLLLPGQVAELVRTGFLDVKPNSMKRLSMRYPFLEAEAVFAVQQVGPTQGGAWGGGAGKGSWMRDEERGSHRGTPYAFKA